MGEWYLTLRKTGMEINQAVLVGVPNYEDGGFISSNPAEHHSKTKQNIGDLDDGGAK